MALYSNKKNDSYHQACADGNYDLASAIFENRTKIDDAIISFGCINELKNVAIAMARLEFVWSCENGHLEFAKWLLKCYKFRYDDLINNTFEMSASNGHLKTCQWLFYIWGRDCDKYGNLDAAFKLSCLNGHLDVARWIYTLANCLMPKDGDAFFKMIVSNGHNNIIEWLREMESLNDRVKRKILL